MSTPAFERDFAHHPIHYFTLVCILAIGLWGLFWFDYYQPLQLAIVISMSISYVVWGIVHHWLHRDLHVKIVCEYALMALLSVLVFGSLILRT